MGPKELGSPAKEERLRGMRPLGKEVPEAQAERAGWSVPPQGAPQEARAGMAGAVRLEWGWLGPPRSDEECGGGTSRTGTRTAC